MTGCWFMHGRAFPRLVHEVTATRLSTQSNHQGENQMISIPVSDTSHARLSRVSRWLCSIGYAFLAVFFAWSALSGHRQAEAILKDAVTVQAPVQVDHIEEKRRKGRVSYQYHFRYDFSVDGVEYTGHFSTSEDNATPYLGEAPQVDVAYARSNPAQFDRLDRLEGQKGLGSVLGRVIVALGMLAILAFVVHLLVTRKLFVRQAPALPAV
ncbi:MAG: hypothetical protein K0S73_3216 [Stenotrophomonas rhizophila]|nr:hypothetical protein [Stenotrophomonas rhizophila]